MAWEPCGFGLNCCSHAKRRLSSRNLKTASDVLCDKSYVTIVHSQRHKKRILIVIHLNPLRRTVFHIFSEVRSFFSGAELGGGQGATAPQKFCLAPSGPPKFSAWRHATGVGLFLKVLHRPLTAPLVAKLAPPVAPPNENVWLRPWFFCRMFCW